MIITQVLAKEVQVGDSVLLDWGYGPQEHWEYGRVESIQQTSALFDNAPRIMFNTRYGSQTMSSDFKPEDKVTITRYATKSKSKRSV